MRSLTSADIPEVIRAIEVSSLQKLTVSKRKITLNLHPVALSRDKIT